ncbi:MAG: signal peptidase I [Planctomycetes bacterium]|nr:signal peptidase I [Planctomycetota bacterium]
MDETTQPATGPDAARSPAAIEKEFDPNAVTDHKRSWKRVAVGMVPCTLGTLAAFAGTELGLVPYIRGLVPAFVAWIFVSALTPMAYIPRRYCLLLGAFWIAPCLFFVLLMNFHSVKVEGQSMLDQLVEGDVLLVDETGEPQALGIYVLQVPGEAGNPMVKRLVGLPGQKVEARFGRLFADDVEVHPRLGGAPDQWNETRPVPSRAGVNNPRVLEADEYFVLGDNPLASRDSRQFGPVSREAIKGRVVWSLRGSHGFAPLP